MSRPALRNIDPNLDLSRHLLTCDQWPASGQGAGLFARDAPLEIEVGSGKGLFVVSASGQRPQHNFLGCEIAQKYARLAAARLARAGRDNAVMLQGDALQLFRERLPDACAIAVHAYFPDPWWKQRHRKRRVMQPTFLADVRAGFAAGRFVSLLDRRGGVFRHDRGVDRRGHRLAGPAGGRRTAGYP